MMKVAQIGPSYQILKTQYKATKIELYTTTSNHSDLVVKSFKCENASLSSMRRDERKDIISNNCIKRQKSRDCKCLSKSLTLALELQETNMRFILL